MDLEFLYTLQTMRESLPGFATDAMCLVSDTFGTVLPLVLIALAFWCYDKWTARLLIYTMGFNLVLNSVVKNIFCVYRPWILDSRLHPAEGMEATATGYSFPSGHTMMSTSLLASFALAVKKRWVTVLMCVLIGLVMFSRMWLGCHTPQDVVVGLILALLGIAFCVATMRWAEQKEGRDLICLVVGVVVSVALLVFFTLKPYPLDYAADGTLLVDPYKMIADGYKSIGVYLGCLIGWFVEHRFINFDEATTARSRVLRALVGLFVIGIFYALGHWLAGMMDQNWGKFLEYFLIVLGAMTAAPYLFKRYEL